MVTVLGGGVLSAQTADMEATCETSSASMSAKRVNFIRVILLRSWTFPQIGALAIGGATIGFGAIASAAIEGSEPHTLGVWPPAGSFRSRPGRWRSGPPPVPGPKSARPDSGPLEVQQPGITKTPSPDPARD